MAKDEALKSDQAATVGQALADPQLWAEIEALSTVQAWERFPGLCGRLTESETQKVADEMREAVDTFTEAEAQKRLPRLYARLTAAAPDTVFDESKGFILSHGDPYAAGVLRVFARAEGCPAPSVPFLMPYKAKGTKEALASYVLRANGAGDPRRRDLAKTALKKCR